MSDRPRLLVVHPHFTYPGGASAVALETAQRLAGTFDVHVASICRDEELTRPYDRVEFHDLGGPRSDDLRHWLLLPRIYWALDRVVKRLAPDVILAHCFPSNHWALAETIWRRTPCVWYSHEPSAFIHDPSVIRGAPRHMRLGLHLAHPVLACVDRYLTGRAESIIANSEFTAERVQQIYGRESVVVPPGVDLARYGPSGVKEQTVLAVGRLTKFKRIDLILEAARILKTSGRADISWLIVGDGEEREQLIRTAERLGVGDTVTFLGRVPEGDLPGLYASAQVVAIAADGEPFGMVAIEAMASGTAVVCCSTGGPAQIVRHEVSGLHFTPGDSGALAAQVARLMDNPDEAGRFGRAGRQIAETRFGWDATAEGIRRVLVDAVVRSRGASPLAREAARERDSAEAGRRGGTGTART